MKILMISGDPRAHDPQSAVAKRIQSYREHCESLEVVTLKQGVEEIVKKRDVDVVTAQDPFVLGLLAAIAARRSGARLHLQIHTDATNPAFIFESVRHMLSFVLMRSILPFASSVRVVSERIKTGIENYTSAPITVLPIAINAAPFATTHARPYEYGDHKVVLAVSRLTSEKRVDLIIAAMKHAPPEAHLYIVGDGARRGALHRAGVLAGLQDRIHFLGWQHDTAAYFQHADCFVSASKYEGYGMTLMEALLGGCRVVTADVGIAPNLPSDAVTIVEPREYDMGVAIGQVLSMAGTPRYHFDAIIPSADEYADLFIQSLT